MNQEIETYLRIYCSQHPETWASYLPIAEFAHNTCPHSVTKISPFYALMGFEPCSLPDPLAQGTLEPVETRLANLRKIRTDIESAIELACQVMIHRSSRGADKFEVGDKVWLDGRNLSLAYES